MGDIVPINKDSPVHGAGLSERSFLENLGARVRECREAAGLTRRRLTALADVSERYIGLLEAGEGNISIVLLRRVAESLGTTIPELLSTREEALAERLALRLIREVPAHRMEELLVRLAREVGGDSGSRRERVALVGLRGAGKSTLGEHYARERGMPFIELDREVEREAGLPLTDLFSLYGQAAFRRFERRCLERLLEQTTRAVIAVGGGIVNDPETYELLLRSCYTVWLRADPEEHMSRVVAQGDLRPMAESREAMGELRELLRSRESLYRKADVVVDTSCVGPDRALDRLRQALERG